MNSTRAVGLAEVQLLESGIGIEIIARSPFSRLVPLGPRGRIGAERFAMRASKGRQARQIERMGAQPETVASVGYSKRGHI
jgi:hypothetical protein